MRKVLVCCTIALVAIFAPGRSTHAPSVVDTSSRSVDVPDIPVLPHDGFVRLPDASPTETVAPISTAQPVAPVSTTVSAPDGNTSTSFVQGTTTTPVPPTCNGMSNSQASSENGQRVRENHTNNDCGSDSSCDEPTCEP